MKNVKGWRFAGAMSASRFAKPPIFTGYTKSFLREPVSVEIGLLFL